MKHAFATFFFVASIAGFGGVANALPIASTAGTDVSKSIALDQGANQWNHFIPRGGFSVALDQGANEWNHFVPKGGFKLALDQGANQWNHRGDDDWGVNPRRVI